jgi:hypothetical protein
MGAPKKHSAAYDRYMLEAFQMNKNPNEVFNKINFQELLKGEKPYISRRTIYNRYNEWVADGKPGELESEQYTNEDGEIVVIYRLKQKTQ